jgi:3-methyladenine DNA glycosylase/8-oxoguanine DNA glycosylase
MNRGSVRAYRHLTGIEPVFARLVDEYGHPDPFEWFDGGRTGTSLFAAMALHVIGQRISAAAAFTVFDRVAAATGGDDRVPTPDGVLRLGADGLRAAGLTWAKARCLVELAGRQADGRIDLDRLASLGDDDVVAALREVPGIGLWSAQAFLIRQLHREDVLPADDTGLRRAVELAWALPALPTPRQVRDRGTAWAPYRSYAAAVLWRSLRPSTEPADPKARALARRTPDQHTPSVGKGHHNA